VRPPRLPSVVSTAVCIDRRLHVPILLPRHYPGCIFYLLSSRHLDDWEAVWDPQPHDR
jgi:hypothetical protein